MSHSTTGKAQSPHLELTRQDASASGPSTASMSCVQDKLSQSNVSKKAAKLF